MSGIKYEQNGYIVPHPRGHKKAGWVKSFVQFKGSAWGRGMKGSK